MKYINNLMNIFEYKLNLYIFIILITLIYKYVLILFNNFINITYYYKYYIYLNII